ncbi:MAG: sugar phosphate isomerase/epimerase [Clostridia bacterium]|nr:sugar phosphate isomerase/epimerase [Clostridia bacterium]
MKFNLTAFADESSPEIMGQIDALKRNSMKYIELRGINNKSAYDYSVEESKEFAKIYRENGISVSALGSPVGKIQITDDFEPHFDFLKKCVELAGVYETKLIRLFSFYIPKGEDKKQYRNEVIDRVGKMAEYCRQNGIVPCHENEADIYGESAAECEDLLKNIPELDAVFDPANFIVTGNDAFDAFKLLKGNFEYLHIKDALKETKQIVPAGKGDGRLGEIIADYASKSEKDRFLTLEPHLTVFEGLSNLQHEAVKHKYTFETKEEAFDTAVNSLKSVLEDKGLKYE